MLLHRLLATLLLAATALVFTAPTAEAAQRYNYVGWSGGTLIHAVGSTLTSDLTAQSYVAGITVPKSARNNVASVHVGNIVNTGEVETSERVEAARGGGVRLISKARTAHVDLLDGLVTADAVITKTVTTAVPGERMKTRANTRYVGLHIVGVDLPVDIPKNFKVGIDGLATIVVNGQETKRKDGTTSTNGYGLKIVLLSAFEQLGGKSVIILNPTFAGLAPSVPVDAPRLAGYAFGTRVHTTATSEIQIDSGRTANVAVPPGGTNGTTIQNSTGQVLIRGILRVGAIYSTSRGLTDSNFGEVTNTAEIAGVNVLSGLITADVIKVRAHAKRVDNVFRGNQTMKLVNLVVAGNEIPIDVSPNTKISIGDLAVVTINKRVRGKQYVGITGIHVKLLKPRGDVPAGGIIRIGEALAWITPNGR